MPYDFEAFWTGHSRRTTLHMTPAALHRLMNTDEAMDDADAHIYTTTTIMHGECEAKIEDDDHDSLIGGTLAS